MATNLTVDTQLLNQAIKMGGLKTENDTVNLALQEFIQRRAADNIIAAFGTVDYDEGYDYKAARNRNV